MSQTRSGIEYVITDNGHRFIYVNDKYKEDKHYLNEYSNYLNIYNYVCDICNIQMYYSNNMTKFIKSKNKIYCIVPCIIEQILK